MMDTGFGFGLCLWTTCFLATWLDRRLHGHFPDVLPSVWAELSQPSRMISLRSLIYVG